MGNLFSEFKANSLEEWTAQIVRDLKGKELSILDFHDPIEEIDYRAYYHKENQTSSGLTPGSFPATRGSKTDSNDWHNGAYFFVSDEKSTNKDALAALMRGADLLYFDADKTVDWSIVLNDIQLGYIKAQFRVKSTSEAQKLLEIAGNSAQNISLCFDAIDFDQHKDVALLQKEFQVASFVVNGFGVQQCGANTWQEIAFCLAVGHETLVKLQALGFSIDQAAAMIHFHVGVGANYFNEIAKFRALRMLWSKVIDAYDPNHNCSHNAQITSIIGYTNKSLQDPYTNLLRQTTEVMSATNGSDGIIVMPYDLHSTSGVTELATRMALNISLVLKEESYLHRVIDPTGGSYSIEHLTDMIGRKAWTYFQEIERSGGISDASTLNAFKSEVEKKRNERQSLISEGKSTLIGVNKYPDPKARQASWKNMPGYLGMEAFVAELIEKADTV